MSKKYKYTKKELARKIYDIDHAGLPIDERKQKYMELLEDAGDIPVWSPYTLKLFIRELIKMDEEALKEFFDEENTDCYWVLLGDSSSLGDLGDGNSSTRQKFKTYDEAYAYMIQEMPTGKGSWRHIDRLPVEAPNGQYSEHEEVLASYNEKGEIIEFGGDYLLNRRMHLHYEFYLVFGMYES